MLVDVRHEASHSDLPSLPVLRLAAGQAWQWLGQHYWGAQTQFLQQLDQRHVALLQVGMECWSEAEVQQQLTPSLPAGHAGRQAPFRGRRR